MDLYRVNGASYKTTGSTTVYKLEYEMVSFGLTQFVYVELLGPSSFKLLDSNYSSSITNRIVFRTINSMSIIDDVWLPKINNIILAQYVNLLGQNPSILKIELDPPFYRMTYEGINGKYVFFLEYDYLQNRIMQGNITIIRDTQSTTESSQTQVRGGQSGTQQSSVTSTSSTQSQSSSSQSSSRTSSQRPSSVLTTETISRSTEYARIRDIYVSTEISKIISYLQTLKISLSLNNIMTA